MSRAPRSPAARRDWGSDDSQANILHVDMDAFYASVEILDNPALAGKPIAVGGIRRGVVAAASYEARAFGVNSAMPVGLAYQRCPSLLMLPVRMDRYREVSRQIMGILGEVTPLVEQLSVDEAFLDVSGARRLFGSPAHIGQLVRSRIRAEVGVPSSVGIAATKHVAKIASAHAKPDGMLLIPRARTLEFLHGLPVGALWGVGEKTRDRLERAGIDRVGDIAELGEEYMVRLLGQAAGVHLYELSMGIDARPIEVERVEKSMSAERTFFDCLTERADIESVLLSQSHEVARRLRDGGFATRTISIKVRFADFSTITRSLTFDYPSNLASDIYAAALRLMAQVHVPPSGIRLLGVRAGQLSEGDVAIPLPIEGQSRHGDVERAMDAVIERFGEGAVAPASLVRPEVEGEEGQAPSAAHEAR